MKKLVFSIIVCLVVLGVFLAVKREEPLTEEKIQIDWAYESDSETVTLALREQILPTDFVYNGERVTLNGPYFTGIPTDSTYSYNKRYAFENGLVGFEVTLGKGVRRRFLVDKSGAIVNFNHHTDNVVSDSVAISTYPEGLEIVQTGEPDNYEQQLFTTGGRALSEKFDSIGFFYNGLALVTRDGRVGIIDSDGKTLLSPCIDFDDLRYPPDDKGFWVRYMCEDAFVLPIGKEFAVFTLTRGETEDKGIKPLDKNSAKELIRAYLPSAYDRYRRVTGGQFSTEVSSVTVEGRKYYRIIEEDFLSIDSLRDYLLEYYTEECTERILTASVERGPRYIELDGGLYCTSPIDSAYTLPFYVEGVSIIEGDAEQVLLEVNYGFTSMVLRLEHSGTDWRFDNTAPEGEYGRTLQPYEETEIIRVEDGYLYLEDSVYSRPLSTKYTEDEVRRIFEQALERGINVCEKVRNTPLWSRCEPAFSEGYYDYYLLDSAELTGLDDIWQMTYGAYTESASKRLFENEIGSESEDCRYIERDGKVYYHNSGHGRNFEYLYNTVKVVYQYDGVIVLTVSRLSLGEVEENVVFVMSKTPLGWRLENSENEAFNYEFFYADEGDYLKRSVALPKDIEAVKYTPDALSSLDDFEWGDYRPLVSFATERYSMHDNIDAFAFLGDGIEGLEDGHLVWAEFNGRYLASSQRIDFIWQGESVLENTALADYLFDSKITYAYGDTLGRTRFVTDGDAWHSEYDILNLNGEVLETRRSLYPSDIPGGGYYLDRDDGRMCITPFEEYENYNITNRDDYRIFHSDGKARRSDVYRVYSVKMHRLLYEIELERRVNEHGDAIEHLYPITATDKYMVLAYGMVLEDYVYQCVYLYDIERDLLVLLEDYAEDVIMSPDLKYIAYRSPDYDRFFGESGWNNMTEGVYVKNLETGERVMYPYKRGEDVTAFALDCVCWSS
ncbi:MAG: hypothetical protein IKV53_07580 [Clostridia bacterium]|nr:hypothetical protein [Clostridia bacterium]